MPEGESAGSGLRLQPSSKRDTAATRAYSGGGGGQPLTAPLSRLLAVHRALSAVHLARRCLRHAVASSPRAVQSSAWPSGWSSGPSRAISGHLWPSRVISGHLGSSRVISGHLEPEGGAGGAWPSEPWQTTSVAPSSSSAAAVSAARSVGLRHKLHQSISGNLGLREAKTGEGLRQWIGSSESEQAPRMQPFTAGPERSPVEYG